MTRNLGRSRLKPVAADGRKRPDRLFVALLLADADVVPRHELTGIAVVHHLDTVSAI